MGATTRIDWADASWNPVTGCLHGCRYCYAWGIAERFKGKCDHYASYHDQNTRIHVLENNAWKNNGMKSPYPFGFEPTFHRYKLDEPQHWKKPRTIFVCSMADLFGDWVPLEWIEEVFEACKKAPQHKYLFLTKNPEYYLILGMNGMLPQGDNFWFGTSTPTPSTSYFYDYRAANRVNTFVSIEPILEEFGPWNFDKPGQLPGWIIVGAETGNHRGKVVPEKEWVDEIAWQAQRNGVPVFMKESLRTLMGDDLRQEFPWEVR